jgi:signal transduction histidine kinase
MRFRLAFKLILVSLFFLLVIFASITIEVVHINSKNLRSSLQNESKSFAALAVKPIGETFETFQSSGTFQIQTQINQFLALDPNIFSVAIVNTAGSVVYKQDLSFPDKVSPSLASSFTPVYEYSPSGVIQTIYQPFIEDSGQHQYAVVYSISSQSLEQSVHQVETSTILLSAVALVFSAILTYGLLSWLFIHPIQQISRQALIISAGTLDLQIKELRKDEIGDLAIAVNTMANSLKTDIKKLRDVDSLKSEFMMISSHNLRTPLSVIETYLEQLDSLKLNKDAAKLIEIVDANTKRLKVFAENMLTISQMEAGQGDPDPPVTIDSNEFFKGLHAQLNTLTSAKQINLGFNLPPDLPDITIQQRRFHDALWNILDNAIKFTPNNGAIVFGVVFDRDHLNITVKDTGIGIAAEEIPKLFTKFHRGTSTLNYDYEGTGIGLYLAKLIISQQGGTITIESELHKGTIVTITLPVHALTTPATTT